MGVDWVDILVYVTKRRRAEIDLSAANGQTAHGVPIVCSVCMETVEAFQGHSLTACGHSFCKSCLQGYIQVKLSSKDFQRFILTCPAMSCGLNFDTLDVRACTLEHGDATSWQQFQQAATETFLDTAASAEDTSIRRCPTSHCNFTFQYEPSDNAQQGQLFICPHCDEAYCLQCPVVQGKVGPAHDDSCQNEMEEIRESKEERKRKLEKWMREKSKADNCFQRLLHKEGRWGKTKPCPKCGTPITKKGGCNHMSCLRCGVGFKWSSANRKW